MRILILAAGALAMGAVAPAFAKPPPGHGRGTGNPHAAHGPRACPPGLAKKHNGCLPPGQARRLFNLGQRVPTSYNFNDYDDIPLALRDRYQIPSGQDYIYRDQSVYVVDPRTRLVTKIIDLLR
jgi:hypothetical protein